ncbi:MAG: HEAT repeat domain-containing protein [Myxococcota bacterium]
MRNSQQEPCEKQANPSTTPSEWGDRTSSDAASLLLELARAHRGFAFYSEGAPQRGPLCDRAFLALSSEIRRAGPIDFRLGEELLRLGAEGSPIETRGVVDEFVAALRSHGLLRVCLSESLTPTALDGFLNQIVQPAQRFPDSETFARSLAARDARGISINDASNQATEFRSLDETPLRAAASFRSHPNPTETPETPPTQSTPGADDSPATNHLIDTEPLATPSRVDRGERLRARLIELDLTHDDALYQSRAAEIVAWAEELSEQECFDDCYRAEVIFSDHAVGCGGRGEAQARVAAKSFAMLAQGPRLADLVDRAACADAHPVRPAQMLLQLGDAATPVILERRFAEEEGPAAERLESLLLTIGEGALPSLVTALKGQDDRRAQIAIRLAGRIQSPQVLPNLIDSLQSAALGRRVDAIHALSFLPGEASKQALEEALQSDLEEIAVAASQAVATNDGLDAVPTLLDALDVSLRSHRTQLSRALIEVLGRLGDERAVPRLSAALERKPVIRRAHWHAAQLAALDALAILPTKEARRSIERAALYGASAVQDRARARLAAEN